MIKLAIIIGTVWWLTEQTRQAIDDHLASSGKMVGEFLFTGRRTPNKSLTTRQYARLSSDWIAEIGLDPAMYGTHSIRRPSRH
jgi:hypothetical protein